MLSLALPTFKPEPTGPMCRLLRKLAAGSALVGVRTGRHRVLCLLDGHETAAHTVAGLLVRGLLREREVDEGRSEYTLTAAGEEWARGRAERPDPRRASR